MKKPYVICHMVESIDGRIDCHMADKISGDEYYTALDVLGCRASVEGRVTMERYYALPGRYVAADATPVGTETVYRATERTDFHICPDTLGTLRWGGSVTDEGRPLLVIVSESAPAEYLSYLSGLGISYIATGHEHIDLTRAMELLSDVFGVDRLALLGGGLINGAFLEAGLVDEVSLLLAPGIDGRAGWRALFDGISDQEKAPTRLALKSLERFDNAVVWLRYDVIR